jgi:hypothetical protein
VAAFFDAHAGLERTLDYRAGLIATVIANAHRGRQARPVTPGDFFPSLKSSAPSVMTPAEMRARISRHFGLR